MKKARRILILFAAAAAITVGSSADIYAADVNVTLPSFDVTLNGTKMDNAYSKYPLIVYKDITYFPMTYYDCRFLGLETDWVEGTGLRIMKTGTTWDYKPYPVQAKNQTSYRAAIAKLPITVNGETIDNSKEAYPLLLFRDVTYFPLTWRFAVNSFGWSYDFNGGKGLTIQSGGSGSTDGRANANAQEIILPIAKIPWEGRNTSKWGGFTKRGTDGGDYAKATLYTH